MRSSSRDFKKKSKPPTLLPEKLTSSKNLLDLKAKLSTNRQMMKTTGKRFRDSQTSYTEQPPINKQVSNTKQQIVKQKKNISIDTSSKKSISLSEISSSTSQIDLSASQNFQQYGWKQQQKLKKLRSFLQRLKLQKYQKDLIQAGFDDIETLIDIDGQSLNSIKMKASHQKTLLNEINKIKSEKGAHEIGISTQQNMRTSFASSFSIISSRNRPKTQISNYQQKQKQTRTTRVDDRNSRSTLLTENPLVKSSQSMSFIFNAGGKNFSLISKQANNLQRKACCTCFKVTYSPLRYGNYYFCSEECIQQQRSKLKGEKLSKQKFNTTRSSMFSKNQQLKASKLSKQKKLSKQRNISKQKEGEDVLFSLNHISLSSSFVRQYK